MVEASHLELLELIVILLGCQSIPKMGTDVSEANKAMESAANVFDGKEESTSALFEVHLRWLR